MLIAEAQRRRWRAYAAEIGFPAETTVSGAPPPALHSYHPYEKNQVVFVRAPRRVGCCIRAGADRPGNVAPCLSSHDKGWEYAIQVTNDGKVVPLRRRDAQQEHQRNTNWANAPIAAAFDSPQWKRPPYLAPLS